eukprot:m.105541 g.105541  ORF g.105541 m.105541 type:complete len:182 (+) comp15723_c0_seq1:88-633(+)
MLGLGYITELCCWVLGFGYAPFMSFKAIQTDDGGKDDRRWLTFWVVYSILISGPFSAYVLAWFPLYYEAKLGVLVWMLFFNGSDQLYKYLVHPVFKRYEKDLDKMCADLPTTARAAINTMGRTDFVRSALDNGPEFIAKWGPVVYRRVMGIAMKMAQDQLSSPPAPHSTAPDQPMSVKTQW